MQISGNLLTYSIQYNNWLGTVLIDNENEWVNIMSTH